ncbi:hypothetical protein HIM_02262 [Hirsutella minnesotensis 3608]|nr:hypothetical protein HIM_02262 [Hirsutella minnesotensis 3608]
MERHCLVTVGATVGFQALTEQALEPSFWAYLRSKAFTALHIQCGPDIDWAGARLDGLRDEIPAGLAVDLFDVRSNMMQEEMTLCKVVPGRRAQGLVISHAGTGTILDAWRLGVPLIVVPNTSLLHDHQTEMAEHLAQEGYATMAAPRQVAPVDHGESLQGAIHKAELLVEESKATFKPHPINTRQASALRLWDIGPTEVAREEKVRMSLD